MADSQFQYFFLQFLKLIYMFSNLFVAHFFNLFKLILYREEMRKKRLPNIYRYIRSCAKFKPILRSGAFLRLRFLGYFREQHLDIRSVLSPS